MTTKWKSELFSNEKMKNEINKNIDIHQLQEKIKNIKNINNIEPFETIEFDENNNLKEGLFERDEFTGYDYDDPVHVGNLSNISGSITDFIDKIYDNITYLITLTATYTVDSASGKGDKGGNDPTKDEPTVYDGTNAYNPSGPYTGDGPYTPPQSFDEGFENIEITADPVNTESTGGININEEENTFMNGFSEDGSDKRSKKQQEEDRENNIKVVRKYVALFFCLSIAYFATFNWYFLTTLVGPDGKVNDYINTLRQNKDIKTDEYPSLSSFFFKKQGTSENPNLFFIIIYFFFGISFKVLDHVNYLFIQLMPNMVTNNVGKLVTFLFLYVLIVLIFYYFADFMKDWLKSLLTGKGYGILSTLLTFYILGVCAMTFFSDRPWDHYVSNFTDVLSTSAQGGIMGSVYMGVMIVINLLRYCLMAAVTISTLPILLALAIIFYSFFSILFLGDKGIASTFKDIFSDCTENFKSTKFSDQDKGNTTSIIKWWLIFILMLICDFFFHGLLNIAYVFVFGIAIIDYLEHITGKNTRDSLIQITSLVLGIAGFFVFGIFKSVASNKMIEAGFVSIKIKSMTDYDSKKEVDPALNIDDLTVNFVNVDNAAKKPVGNID